MHKRGFTLIETIIYLALFSIIMAGLIASVYLLLDGTRNTTRMVAAAEEINFVTKKIDWALSGAEGSTVDISLLPSELKFKNKNISLNFLYFRLSSEGNVEMEIDGEQSALTTVNVKVEDLRFSFDPTQRLVTASVRIDGIITDLTKFLRI